MLDSEIVTASKCGFQNGKPIVNALLRMQLNGRRRDGVLACFGAEVSGCLECALFEWARGLCLTPPLQNSAHFRRQKRHDSCAAAARSHNGISHRAVCLAAVWRVTRLTKCVTLCDARNAVMNLFTFSSPVTKLKVLQTKISFHGIFFIYTEKSNYFALAE